MAPLRLIQSCNKIAKVRLVHNHTVFGEKFSIFKLYIALLMLFFFVLKIFCIIWCDIPNENTGNVPIPKYRIGSRNGLSQKNLTPILLCKSVCPQIFESEFAASLKKITILSGLKGAQKYTVERNIQSGVPKPGGDEGYIPFNNLTVSHQ